MLFQYSLTFQSKIISFGILLQICASSNVNLQKFPTTPINIESNLEDFLRNDKIIPDVIDTAPKDIIRVQFYSGVTVEVGNTITPAQAKKQPITSWNSDLNKYYTLALIDPDAPSRKKPKFREWNHWLVGNIPGEYVMNGDSIADYYPPSPPKDSGLHRYIFLVFQQNKDEKINFTEPHIGSDTAEGRANFSIRTFAKKYNMGEPIATNYFLASADISYY